MSETKQIGKWRQAWRFCMTQGYLKYLVGWLCVFVVVLVVHAFAEKKSASSIFVEPNNLSSHELNHLHKTVQALGVQQFYRADLRAISDAVLKVSWVDKVSVYRDWHKGIVVVATPKKAVANFGSEHMLDVSGVPFVPANKAHLGDASLTQLYGRDSDTRMLMNKAYKLNLWFAPMGLTVQDMIVTPRKTWLIRFNTGLRVTVDYERVDEKLYTLSQLLADGRLPVELDKISAIDLRYKDGFSITKKIATQTQSS